MGELEVRAQLSTENLILKEWREASSSGLPALIRTLAHLKEFLNEFLADLHIKRNSNTTTAQKDPLQSYPEAAEDCDEEKGDLLSGTIQELMRLKKQSESKNEQDKYLQKAKKMKT